MNSSNVQVGLNLVFFDIPCSRNELFCNIWARKMFIVTAWIYFKTHTAIFRAYFANNATTCFNTTCKIQNC